MPLLAIIADDLTGANDTGVQFAKYGLRTHVIIEPSSNSLLPNDSDVVVFNTDSRGLHPTAAYERVAQIARMLKSNDVPIIYKKVDSTLRGNLGAEIDSLLDTYGFECAIVAPAFPRNGRITVGGYHLLHQTPLELTEIAQDPKSPVTDSHLVTMLKKQSHHAVGHVQLANVLAGGAAIRQGLQDCLENSKRLIAFDATDEGHLAAIAQTVKKTGHNVLWVGSAGMAEYLPSLYELPKREICRSNGVRGLPVLVVAGSISSVTASQINAFTARSDTALVTVDGKCIIENTIAEVTRCINTASMHLAEKRHVALVSSRERESVERARAVGSQWGLDFAAVSDQIANKLGEIARELVSKGVEGLFLTGGDTAVRVCAALGASSLEVCSEIAPGIPFCQLSSGPFIGLKVVTKAGAFGDEQTINKAISIILNS